MTGRHTDQSGRRRRTACPRPQRRSHPHLASQPGRQFQRGVQPCRCAEGGRIELPRACASAVFKTVPVAIRRVGPPRVRRPALVGASLLRRDLNPRPPHYECGALPAELRSVRHGDAPCCSALNSMVFESHRVCRACLLPSPWRSDEGIEPRTARTSLRRRDSNPRPPGYEPGGLPTCPTPRWLIRAATLVSGRSHRHPPR